MKVIVLVTVAADVNDIIAQRESAGRNITSFDVTKDGEKVVR